MTPTRSEFATEGLADRETPGRLVRPLGAESEYPMITTETRNATLEDLVPILREQHDAKCDAVVPATAIRSVDGMLRIAGMSAEALAGLSTDVAGVFRPTVTMDEHLSQKLGVPVAYLRRLRDERPDLYDANINGWLHGSSDERYGPDHRKFLVRTFTSLEGPGIGRALLSDSFQAFDYLDVVTVTLEALAGLRDTGRAVEVVGCDISERRMILRVVCPDIAAVAPTLLGDYRSPITGFGSWTLERLARSHSASHLGWDMSRGETPPLLFAGFEISTSETGGGATTLVPRIVAQACKNGLKVTKDVMRKVHLGSKLEAGVVRWSSETQRKNLELIRSQVRDAVATCLSQEYLDSVVADIEGKAGREIAKPDETIRMIGKQLSFSAEQTDMILDHFIRGGQMTAGGVLNAVTSAAQMVTDVETAYAMENAALDALEIAARA